MGLWTRKSLSALEREATSVTGLKRALGPFSLTMIGVGSTIGAGIFVITGTAAAEYAGPALAISFLIAGFTCLCTALCYAELASMIPVAGSAYTYAYATLGEFVAWIIGWCLVLEYAMSASTVAVGWSGYFTEFLMSYGVKLPMDWISAPLIFTETHSIGITGAWFNVPAAGLVLLLTGLLILGIKESTTANSIMTMIKIGAVILVILFGAAYVDPENWTPFIPENTGQSGHYGWSGIFRASGIIFFAYIGFDAISTAAQEAKNPQRDMSISLLWALGICTALYVMMSLVMTGLAHYSTLNVPDPVYKALRTAGANLSWLTPFIVMAAIIGLASATLLSLYGQTRVSYVMARDGLIPRTFADIHPRYRTPLHGTVITGLFSALIAGLFPIEILGELVSIGTLLAFAIVCMGVLILRHRAPELKRPFRVPFAPLLPLVGMCSCFYLMYSLPGDTWIRLVVWLAIGLVIYFGYGRRNAALTRAREASETGQP
ncbi:amino acid permease [Govanella unica]|uniref:Amino acid permease n=1 Tax=Govanella unica TaxID=2975056 RepID=A0A9X3TZP7_9PROT|nr:amino acid permease [Govania unica]MDA5194726.1 amino acid permease [Govania unica]